MRKPLLLAAALGAVVLAAVAFAGPPTATGVWLDPSVDKQFINCAATGSSMQVIVNGKYLMRVMEADVNLVFGTTYDGGALNNRPFPMGFGFLQSFYADDGGTQVSCQSADGGGDVYFTGTH